MHVLSNALESAGHAVQQKIPEIATGTGSLTAVFSWMNDHPTIIPQLTGAVGMCVGIAGFCWMIFRDVYLTPRRERAQAGRQA